MATFKNVVTGNIVIPSHEDAEKLMRESDRYVEVAEAAPAAPATGKRITK